jgi:hypothetical protein
VKLDEKMFVKDKLPRPRNITAPSEAQKVKLGPFIYSLDQIFCEYDDVYCGGCNWE